MGSPTPHHAGGLRLWTRLSLICAGLVYQASCSCVRNTTAQISSSVFLAGNWDYMDWYKNGSSNCISMVDKIAKQNVRQIQFLPTFYWYDVGPLDPPPGFDETCSTSDLGGYYCFNRFNATRVQHWCYDRQGLSCQEVTQQNITDLIENLGGCMKHAVDLGFDIAINSRVDDGRALGGWRNTLDFDPLEISENWSYLEAVLYPLADAVRLAAKPSTRVDFVLQGEMGATIFMHPIEWMEVKDAVLERVTAPRPGQPDIEPAQVFFGMAVNNNKLCGCIGIGIEDATEYLAAFPASFNAVKAEFDLPALKALFYDYDFIGISAYVPMRSPNFSICDFEGLMERLDEELSYYDLSLEDLVDDGKEIHFVEFGIGGGTNQAGVGVARTAEQAAYYPFYGIYGAYSCQADPFNMCDLVTPSPVRDYRRKYFEGISQYLLQGGCRYRVSTVYLWNLQSWDPQAIYPLPFADAASQAANPTAYYDPVVVATINAHNAEAAARADGCAARAPEPELEAELAVASIVPPAC
ncbi:hypothetical protein ACKKBG_A29000 [Auxenochlorella protothecoides x Auxenochlorella symbiontica]